MLSRNDMLNMRATQTAHMHDTANILSFTAGALDEYGAQSAPTYPAAGIVILGLDVGAGSETETATRTVIQYDAVARLPLSAAIKETDRLELLTHYGFDVDPVIYEIVSPPRVGGTAIRLLLRKVVK